VTAEGRGTKGRKDKVGGRKGRRKELGEKRR